MVSVTMVAISGRMWFNYDGKHLHSSRASRYPSLIPRPPCDNMGMRLVEGNHLISMRHPCQPVASYPDHHVIA